MHYTQCLQCREPINMGETNYLTVKREGVFCGYVHSKCKAAHEYQPGGPSSFYYNDGIGTMQCVVCGQELESGKDYPVDPHGKPYHRDTDYCLAYSRNRLAKTRSYKTTYDPINRPQHYARFTIEPLAAIESWQLDYHLGNVVKYIARAKHKGSELEDLEKARFYLDRKIEQLRAQR